MITRKILITVLVTLTTAASVGAQTPPVVKPADSSGLGSFGLTLTPEELKVHMDAARVRRLTGERDQVAVDIRNGVLFDADKKEAALKVLYDNPKNTWKDNARRISQAFAIVDKRFGKAWTLLKNGDHKAAAAAVKPLISNREAEYFDAAKRFCLAEALIGRGPNEDAIDVYLDLVKEMPDRFSFAALSLLRAGRTYEKLDRRINASALYNMWVDSYGVLDHETSTELIDRADAIAADYKDPLRTVAGKMSEVEKRLTGTDSGRTTQTRQKEIVAMLSDLIATAEENQQQSQSQSKKEKEGEEGDKEGKKGKGEGKKPGTKPGPAQGIGIPKMGALISQLAGGDALEPTGLRKIHTSDLTDDWGQLSPKEQKKLTETFKETMSERYREMSRDYYRGLAGGSGDSE